MSGSDGSRLAAARRPSGRPAPRPHLLSTVVVVVLLVAVAGCSSSDGGSDDSAPSAESRLLTDADLTPLEPEETSVVDELQDGSPHWACGGVEFRELLDDGLTAQGRYFGNGTEDWAVYSSLITVPDVPADDALTTMARAHEACTAKQQTMPELELGDDRWGYRSEADGATDALRGYAVVGEHELVQVSVFGLDRQPPPERLQQLLDRAVRRAT